MKTLVPIKRFTSAKLRLSGVATQAQRAALAQAMAERVLSELSMSRTCDGVLVVSSEACMRPLAARLGFELLADEGAGLNAAITRGMRHLRNQGETDIAVVHADLPLFQASEFDRVAARHAAGPARKLTLVSDLVGNGTNLRLCRPGDAIPPLYGKMSAARHREAARRAGLAVETVASPILEFDCDTPEDLRRLMQMPQSEADDRGRFAGLGFPLSAAPRAEERSRP